MFAHQGCRAVTHDKVESFCSSYRRADRVDAGRPHCMRLLYYPLESIPVIVVCQAHGPCSFAERQRLGHRASQLRTGFDPKLNGADIVLPLSQRPAQVVLDKERASN